MRRRLVALRRPGWSGGQTRRRAEVDIGAALVHLAVVVEIGAYDDVGVAVSVDVACRPHCVAEERQWLVALGGAGQSPSPPRRPAAIDKRPSFLPLTVVPPRGAAAPR